MAIPAVGQVEGRGEVTRRRRKELHRGKTRLILRLQTTNCCIHVSGPEVDGKKPEHGLTFCSEIGTRFMF